MHPHLIGACADECQARMLAKTQITRLASQAGSRHRRAHIKTLRGRWVGRFTMWRIRALPDAQIRLQERRPARRAAGTAPAP